MLFSHDEAYKYMSLESVYVKMIFNVVLFWYQEAEMTNNPSIAYFLQSFSLFWEIISETLVAALVMTLIVITSYVSSQRYQSR